MENKRAPQRERKEKKRGRGRAVWLGLLCAVLLGAGIYLWSFLQKGKPLPQGEDGGHSVEQTPVLTAAPEPRPTPEPTLYIPAPQVSIYTAVLSVEEGEVRGSLQLHYVNTGEDTIFAVPLHIYPNSVTPDIFRVNSLSLNGKRAYYTLAEDLLTVPLAMELAPGEDCVIYMDFSIDLAAGEYGSNEHGEVQLAYLLPAAAVYENGWLTDAEPHDVSYTAPGTYSVIMQGAAQCSVPGAEQGYYYGENIQGFSVTLE